MAKHDYKIIDVGSNPTATSDHLLMWSINIDSFILFVILFHFVDVVIFTLTSRELAQHLLWEWILQFDTLCFEYCK